MTPKRWTMWEWIDDTTGQVVFVGFGPGENADQDFAQSVLRRGGSPLADWIASLGAFPKRSKPVVELIHRSDAASMCYARRSALRREGVTLLTLRRHGTYAGGGHSKAVLSPAGDIYLSVREAARETGVTAATISRYCNDPLYDDWSFLE